MVKPVCSYKKLNYPTKIEITLNPELLNAIPKRWNGNRYVCTALTSLLLIGLTACSQKGASNGIDPQVTIEKPAVVAPIFEHGEGRGSFGCVSITPPAFLSEEEALQVIQEEARNAGLDFESGGHTLSNIKIPITSLHKNLSQSEGDNSKDKFLDTKDGDLELDGLDKDRNIAFEFVSKDDVVSWHQQGNMWSSVEDYPMLDAARTLEHGLNGNTGELSVGVFYDPVSWIDKNGFVEEVAKFLKADNIHYDEMEITLKKISEEQLREQVKDFIEWLKGEGII